MCGSWALSSGAVQGGGASLEVGGELDGEERGGKGVGDERGGVAGGDELLCMLRAARLLQLRHQVLVRENERERATRGELGGGASFNVVRARRCVGVCLSEFVARVGVRQCLMVSFTTILGLS